MGLLRLAAPGATTDDMLDWLKSSGVWTESPADTEALDGLEAGLRRCAWTRADPSGMPRRDADRLPADGMALWYRVQALVGALRWSATIDLAQALGRFRLALEACGLSARLDADVAGREVRLALHLHEGIPPWARSAGAVSLAEFTDWADSVLEASSFRPADPASSQVRVMPLARALWRPFSAVVLPAVDAQSLGSGGAPLPWISPQDAAYLGLPTPVEQLGKERWAFESLLALPGLTLLRRRAEGDAMLAASPLVERVALGLARRGQAWAPAHGALQAHEFNAEPVPRPQPRVHHARELWPSTLNATACESLRACPYQFHARSMLGLREAEELGR